MRARSLRWLAVGICLLLGLATAYNAGATPPPPKQSTPDPDGAATIAGAIELRQPRQERLAVVPAAALMSEGFEGAWPGPSWTVDDLSAGDGGEFYWGKRNCHPHTGGFAAWAAGGGAQGAGLGCASNYPNNARSWALYGPIDLRGASAASLTFHFWGRTELSSSCQFDFFFVGSSTDQSNFFGDRYCGNWTAGDAGNGYYQRTFDLTDRLGQAQVWIAFVFASDGTAVDNGIAIDDLSLDVSSGATPSATPSLTRTATPTATPSPTRTATPVATPGQGDSFWFVYLPAIARPANAQPTSTPTPSATATATASPSPTPTGTPVGEIELDGTWSGTTSQGYPISFTVANRAITYLQVGYHVPGCTVTVFYHGAASISGTTFTVNGSSGGGTYTVGGAFASQTAASGSMQAFESGQFCSGSASATWTAARQ